MLYVEANRDGTVGGSHRILYDLVTHLDRARFDPVVLFYQNNPFVERLRAAGVDVHLWEDVCALEERIRREGTRPARLLDYGRAILRRRALLKRLDIDLLHLNNSIAQGNDDWLPAAWLCRIPCFVTAMGDAEPRLGVVHRWLAGRFDRVICISRYLHESLLRYGLPERRLVLAQTGVDLARLRSIPVPPHAQVRERLGVAAETFMVAMVGNIRHWKGQHVVIEALSLLDPGERRDLVVVFAGAVSPVHSRYHESLLARVREAGLEDNVRFIGTSDEVHALFSAADVAVHASMQPEPFGLVLVEAMAAGTPVIASDEGGPAEMVTPETGIRFRMGDAAALAGALRELMNDPDRRQRMGEAARRRAEEFDIGRFIERVQRVYEIG